MHGAILAKVGYLEMQGATRMIILKVMQENKIDVFVNPEQTTTQYLLGDCKRTGDAQSRAVRRAAARALRL